MRVILSFLLSIVCLIPWSVSASDSPVLLILGDSLSAGYGMDREHSWVNLLELRLKQNGHSYRILNSSISGDTTQGGLARLPRLIDRYHPEFVIIELGGNDGLRGINPDVTRQNMTRMIQYSKQAGARVLLTGIKLPPNYGEAYLQKFESIYTDLASEYDTLLVPFFMDGVVFEPGMLQADGIHPNEKGQPVLLENVWVVLEPELELLASSEFGDTQQEINHLLDFVENTDCQYDRNGSTYSGSEAREHISLKYEYYKSGIDTTEDFIKYAATRSKISGQKYKIRCQDDEPVFAEDWLLSELEKYRKNNS